jgi:BirA family biotin operon repressor/biotin-[acetyl-CoA-carboxylase] ligase
MNNNIYQIITLLADGKSRSGQEIGDLLNITRSAVWKIMHKLTELGIPIERNQGKGYRFTRPVQILNREIIYSKLSKEPQELIPQIEIFDSVESTNNSLLAQIKEGKPSGSLVFAEHQTAGRGRLGRTWHSPYAANIYFSLYWHFTKDTSELCGLSQVISLAIHKALSNNNVSNLRLKWPNDICHEDKKLASVLIDLIAESHSSTDAIIGVSVNVNMPETQSEIDQPWTDIHTITQQFPDRNILASTLIEEIYTNIRGFQQNGFAAFAKLWAEYDALANKNITAFNAHQQINGLATGIGQMGELLIQTADGLVSFLNGSVKLQPVSE